VVEGASATFAIALNNGDNATIQWLRNGTAIPGAAETTYTLNGATLATAGDLLGPRHPRATTSPRARPR